MNKQAICNDDFRMKIEELCENEETIFSLTERSWHKIESTKLSNNGIGGYKIRYMSGGFAEVNHQSLWDLYNILWNSDSKRLTNVEMERGGYAKLRWKRWFTPGSAMLAILPHVDPQIQVTKNPAGLIIRGD
jgi:hypothetical protein